MFVIVEIGQACKHNNYKTIITKCFVASQTSMNVILQMEDVNTIVLTPLEAQPAAVMRDTCWIRMVWTAVVSNITDQNCFFHDDKLQGPPLIDNFVVQILMSVKPVIWTTVIQMHSVLTQKEVSSAFATQVTLEMGSTVQVRYITNKFIFR